MTDPAGSVRYCGCDWGVRVPEAMEIPVQGQGPETNNEIKQRIRAQPTQMRMLRIRL